MGNTDHRELARHRCLFTHGGRISYPGSPQRPYVCQPNNFFLVAVLSLSSFESMVCQLPGPTTGPTIIGLVHSLVSSCLEYCNSRLSHCTFTNPPQKSHWLNLAFNGFLWVVLQFSLKFTDN